MLFEKAGIKMPQVLQVAMRHQMHLTSCGFIPGDAFSPYTAKGLPATIKELRKQLSWQVFFAENGAGDTKACGPILDAWRADRITFNGAGFSEYIKAIAVLMEEMGLSASAEVVNGYESSIPTAYITVPGSIRALGNKRLNLHADVVHIASYVGMEGVLSFLRKHKEIIGTVELGMPGRVAMKDVPAFVAIAEQFFKFISDELPDVPLAVEQFDFETVISKKAFNLGHIYSSRRPGIDVFNDDVAFLRQYGVL